MEVKKYNLIDIMRLICAIMIVAIHTHPFEDINPLLGYIGTQVLPRIGLPFFFAISGYFYIKNLNDGKDVSFKYIKRLLNIYIIWSLIYFSITFIKDFQNNISFISFVKKSLIEFFIYGSYYHLWFFPAIIFCVILTTIFYKMKKLKLLAYISLIIYFIGVLFDAYNLLITNIPILNELFQFSKFGTIRQIFFIALPFFVLGYFLNILKSKIENVSNKKMIMAILIIVLLYIAEIILVVITKVQVSIVITFMLYPLLASIILLLLNNKTEKFSKVANFSKKCANWLYYSHPLFILVLTTISLKLFHIKLTQTPTFILTCVISIMCGMVIMKINNKILNKLIE